MYKRQLLEPLIVRAQRRLHLRRSFTAAVLTLVLVGGVLAVLIALAVQLVEQAVALVSSLPELLAALPETMASLERRLEGFCAACPDGVRQTACLLYTSRAGPVPVPAFAPSPYLPFTEFLQNFSCLFRFTVIT